MCCCYCKSRFSKFPLISGVTKTLFNMVKKFEVNRTISKFSIICSLETFINQRDQTFLARSIRARITREKFLHVQKNVNIHTVTSVKSIRNILCDLKHSLACPDARERAGPVGDREEETQAQRARARRDNSLAFSVFLACLAVETNISNN